MNGSLSSRVFNPYVLVLVNFILIVSVETIGNGHFFVDTGLIHAVAIMFIILAGFRLFERYPVTDPAIRRFTWLSLAAMATFAVSHVVEFMSYKVLKLSEDASFANVVNFYVASILMIGIGVEYFLQARRSGKGGLLLPKALAVVLLAGLTVLFVVNDKAVDMDPAGPVPWLYAAVVLVSFGIGVARLRTLERKVPALAPFIRDMSFALVLILLATVPNIFYEALGDRLGIPKYQVINLAHFGFYASMSVFFLAFERLKQIGGIYKDLSAEDVAEAMKE